MIVFLSSPFFVGRLHYLYLLADGCLVLAELVIRQRRLRLPQTYAESFNILGECGVIPSDFAYAFAFIAGFRNFLVHDYERVDDMVVCSEIMKRLEGVDQYLQFAEETVR